jgi:uncharacterized membrane protein
MLASVSMTWTRRFFLALAMGLMLAAIAHILAILLISRAGQRSAYAMVAEQGEMHRTYALDALNRQGTRIPFQDPAATLSLCAFNLAQAPLRVRAPMGEQPMSLSFHTPDGRVFYSVNDRAAQRGAIDLVIMDRFQLDEALNLDDEESVPVDIRILSPSRTGFVAMRAIAATVFETDEAKALTARLTCQPDPAAIGAK